MFCCGRIAKLNAIPAKVVDEVRERLRLSPARRRRSAGCTAGGSTSAGAARLRSPQFITTSTCAVSPLASVMSRWNARPCDLAITV